ncbi:helix-turn-helix domain-containing protein [Streptomyces sp. NBC_01304]|uniref:helix-turn-helix domain-containing protein n=1 Tax=Streptomyces sp. NBC_01304 TaxID=2903818 RepID=UPI002E0EB018|nr:helix-turn-helix domain-containing protein [Streptomyces sp. NBC_01304]
MPEQHEPPNPPRTFGDRVRRAREIRGMTRPVLGGLVGRSSEWVKGIENGRLGVPRLPMLLSLADVLNVSDLAELTGDERLSASTYTKAAHQALPVVREALTTFTLTPPDTAPPTVAELTSRVHEAWKLWHGPYDHRTRISMLLPDLLADLQHASHVLDGIERRKVLVQLAQTYHLTQLYLSFQPVPELVMLTGDRAMAAAQDADSPRAIAAAAWYMNHVFRDAGERHEARVDLAMKAAGLLDRDRSPEEQALWGLLHLAGALSFAKVGRKGDAERFWDQADDAAKKLGSGYTHPWLIFGRGTVDAYAITMNTDLVQSGPAVAATEVDVETIPSATRRSFHLIEAARAHHLAKNDVAAVSLLKMAHEESPETIRYNLFTRGIVGELETRGPKLLRADARYLRQKIGAPLAA